ncbi:hypothetical protein [Enterovirga aerilata]|uniref:Uncharacterized protein n=1 Tax=Enterovirga aerilata TaxID=2730920 RepID=A0A849I6M4_9HYPH|nr:hypothetical protein [Enterovirga sp. DB1703]NNM71687.1 hypothetical protein [Enterovirga sp. DB1703]
MQGLLRLLRLRLARFASRRRPPAAGAADPALPNPQAAPNTTILSYDSFR